MAPTTTINAPDAVSVPDGTAATAANMGIDALAVNGASTAKWVTLPDGRRGVEFVCGADGDTMELDFIDRFDVVGAGSIGYEFDYLYDNSGASITDDETYRAVWCFKNSVVDPGGSNTQLILNHRYFDEEGNPPPVAGMTGALRIELDTRQDVAGTDVSSGRGAVIYPGVEVRYGFHWINDASDGSIDLFLNGHRVIQSYGCNTSFLDGVGARYGRLRLRERAGEKHTIIYPLKIWDDADGRDDMRLDRTDTDAGRARLVLEEPHIDGAGIFEQTSGSLTVATDAPSGGVGPRRRHVETSGTGDAVVKLRSEHSLGPLPEIAPGRFLVSAGNFQIPSGESATVRLGSDTEDDLLGFVLNAAGGASPTTRPLERWVTDAIQVDTGLDFNDTRWFSVYYALNTSEIDTSYIVLIDMSEEVNNQQKVWVYDLPLSAPADCKLGHLVYELSGPGIRFEFPFAFDEDTAIGLPSSWAGGDSATTPVFQTNNNATLRMPHVIEPPISKDFQERYFVPHVLADGGRRVLDFRNTMGGDFTGLRAFTGVTLMFAEGCINDLTQGATVSQIADEWSDIIDACVTYGVKLVVPSNPKIPNFSTAQADAAAELDVLVRDLMAAKNRPDLLSYADMPNTESQAAFASYYSSTDGTHLNDAGNKLWVQELFAAAQALTSSGPVTPPIKAMGGYRPFQINSPVVSGVSFPIGDN